MEPRNLLLLSTVFLIKSLKNLLRRLAACRTLNEPAKSFILKAIANGKHIVTANKALMAVHGQEIIEAANQQGVSVLFEAAVGGGIPIISAIKENLCSNEFSCSVCNQPLTERVAGAFAR